MKNDKPLVSIVTPSYNQGRFIEDTLLSVKNQNYPNIEHIVVDGGSTDNTLDILRKYENEYNLRWISEPDEGQSNGINKGFRTAKGEIIGWLNSDDAYFDRKVIKDVVDAFQSNRKIDIVYGDCVMTDQDNRIYKFNLASPLISYKLLLRQNLLVQPSVLFKKSVVKEHKLDEQLEYSMDYEYWIRLAANKKKFKYINRIISAFRVHPSAKSLPINAYLLKKENKEIRKRYVFSWNYKTRFLRRLDRIIYHLLAIRVIKLYMEICKKRENVFAFNLKFNPEPKWLLSQIPVLRHFFHI